MSKKTDVKIKTSFEFLNRQIEKLERHANFRIKNNDNDTETANNYKGKSVGISYAIAELKPHISKLQKENNNKRIIIFLLLILLLGSVVFSFNKQNENTILRDYIDSIEVAEQPDYDNFQD